MRHGQPHWEKERDGADDMEPLVDSRPRERTRGSGEDPLSSQRQQQRQQQQQQQQQLLLHQQQQQQQLLQQQQQQQQRQQQQQCQQQLLLGQVQEHRDEPRKPEIIQRLDQQSPGLVFPDERKISEVSGNRTDFYSFPENPNSGQPRSADRQLSPDSDRMDVYRDYRDQEMDVMGPVTNPEPCSPVSAFGIQAMNEQLENARLVASLAESDLGVRLLHHSLAEGRPRLSRKTPWPSNSSDSDSNQETFESGLPADPVRHSPEISERLTGLFRLEEPPSPEEAHANELLSVSRVLMGPDLRLSVEESKKIESLLAIDEGSRITLTSCRLVSSFSSDIAPEYKPFNLAQSDVNKNITY